MTGVRRADPAEGFQGHHLIEDGQYVDGDGGHQRADFGRPRMSPAPTIA